MWKVSSSLAALPNACEAHLGIGGQKVPVRAAPWQRGVESCLNRKLFVFAVVFRSTLSLVSALARLGLSRPTENSNKKLGFSINYKRKQTKTQQQPKQKSTYQGCSCSKVESQTSSFGAGGGRTLAFSLAARRLALGESGGARRQ